MSLSVEQFQHSALTEDASAISPTAWTDVLVVEVDSFGDTRLDIVGTPILGCTIGGGYRLLIDGGGFSSEILVDEISLELLSRKAYRTQAVVVLPGGDEVTYTVKLQARATILGSVTPRAGSVLRVLEVSN
jgi:hypothetical protein